MHRTYNFNPPLSIQPQPPPHSNDPDGWLSEPARPEKPAEHSPDRAEKAFKIGIELRENVTAGEAGIPPATAVGHEDASYREWPEWQGLELGEC